jgi:hypothetical protein
MSKIALASNVDGTGTFTLASPNSNSDRTLNLPDASGTVMTDSGTQTANFSALTVNSNNISATNSLGFRNRIINGDMQIDQRNAGASVTIGNAGNLVYTLDRWAAYCDQNSKFSVQQTPSGTGPTGFASYLGVTSLSAYSVGASEAFGLQQSIEGFNTSDLAWGTASASAVTLSFRVYTSLTGAFGGALRNATNNRSYLFSYTVSSANTWTSISITIPGDTTGTWLTTNGAGIRLWFSLGVGSTFSGTAGVWSGSNFVQPTGSVSVVGTSGATFYITGVQLEAGSVATPFERRDYGRELIMCQRYFQITPGYTAATPSYSGTEVIGCFPLYVPMRADPTGTFSGVVFHDPNVAFRSVTAISTLQTATGFGYTNLVIGTNAGANKIGQITGNIRLSAEL